MFPNFLSSDYLRTRGSLMFLITVITVTKLFVAVSQYPRFVVSDRSKWFLMFRCALNVPLQTAIKLFMQNSKENKAHFPSLIVDAEPTPTQTPMSSKTTFHVFRKLSNIESVFQVRNWALWLSRSMHLQLPVYFADKRDLHLNSWSGSWRHALIVSVDANKINCGSISVRSSINKAFSATKWWVVSSFISEEF